MKKNNIDIFSELSKQFTYLVNLQEKVLTLESLSGFDIDEMILLFKQGWTLGYKTKE